MKPNTKKLLLMAAMGAILIALLIMINRHNLIGELACLALTAILFRITQSKHRPDIKP